MPWKRKKEDIKRNRYRRYNKKRKSVDTELSCKNSNDQHASKSSLEITGNTCNYKICALETFTDYILNYILIINLFC